MFLPIIEASSNSLIINMLYKYNELTASGINHEEFKKKVASATTMNSTENCLIIKPIENEELIKRVKAQLL
jgi:hypothetical protein